MQPSTTPIAVPAVTSCCSCDGPLDGNRLNCPACVTAAEQAIREARGATVTPSMIAAVRERLASK